MTEFIIISVLGILSNFLLMPTGAAKYAKYLLKARDYLNILFPASVYPVGVATDQTASNLTGMSKDKVAVPISAVESATKAHGFSLPNLFK